VPLPQAGIQVAAGAGECGQVMALDGGDAQQRPGGRAGVHGADGAGHVLLCGDQRGLDGGGPGRQTARVAEGIALRLRPVLMSWPA